MASVRSLRSGKKQTRLQFQPLPSSSPPQGEYSNAIKNRLANVRFQGARNSKPAPRQNEEDERSLPTPTPTSPAAGNEYLTKSSSPLSSLRTSPPFPPRFVDINDESESDEDDIIPPSSKRRKTSDIKMDHPVNKSDAATIVVKPSNKLTKPISATSSEHEDDSFTTPTRRSSRLTRRTAASQPLEPILDDHLLIPTKTPASGEDFSDIGSAESSEDDVMATQPASKRRSSRQAMERNDPFVVEDDDVESSREDKTRRRKYQSRRKPNQDDFMVGDDEIEYISSAEVSGSALSPLESRHSSNQNQSQRISKQRSNARMKREQEELAEDLLDLQDSEQERSVRKSRTRGGPVTTQRDQTKEHFELLKKRRAGERGPRIIDSGDEDDEFTDDEHRGVDINMIGVENNHIEIISDDSDVLEGYAEVDHQVDIDDEDDFIVEDQPANGRIGRPASDIPLQFTSFASAKPRELFPHIIEWMVKNKISPAFKRHDDLYNLSFARIDDQVKAQAGSRLISSAWNATFKWAILARPKVRVEALPGLDEELIRTCDACNKSNHPARYDFTLSGKAYSKDTLEPIEDSEDENEDEDRDDDQISYDEQGHVLPSESTHFYLGRFCAANADMGHKLTHWKYHLNEQVLSYLEEQGVLAAEAIVSREKLNKKKREKEAEAIVDIMDETGMIAELWQSFQDDLEDARIGMEGHERKGGRGKQRIGSVRVHRDDGTVGDWVEGGKFRKLPTQLDSDSEGE